MTEYGITKPTEKQLKNAFNVIENYLYHYASDAEYEEITDKLEELQRQIKEI